MKWSMYTYLMVLTCCIGCDHSPEQLPPPDPSTLKQPLIKANKELVEIEETDIDNYVQRHKWNMIQTGSGLRYFIYQKGTGKKVEQGKVVRFNYQTELITGKLCYSSDSTGAKEFLVGRGGVESGLEEAVLYLREGDRAKIILPSHLAFGLLGDDDCIPRKAVVIYDLEVLNVFDPINRN